MLKINQRNLVLSTTVVVSLAMCRPVNAASLYSVTDLGVLGTDESGNASTSKAYDINKLNQVVGESGTAAFIWDSSRGMQNLGVLSGQGNVSYVAKGINDNGQVVGNSSSSSSGSTFIWEATTGIRSLGIKGFANAINNQGLVTGFNNDNGKGYIFDSKNPSLGLTELGNGISLGNDINQKGEVAGFATISIVPRASLWNRNGNREDIGLLGSEDTFLFNGSVANAVNNKSQVVGRASVNNAEFTMGGDRAFLWDRRNGIRNLATSGILSGSGQSSANDINDLGQIVGNSEIGAFIWENGVISNLNDLINVNSGWTLTSAEGINEQGYIVGYGTFNGKTRAFLLKPQQQIPELTTFVGLLAFSAVAIKQKQRFKSKHKI